METESGVREWSQKGGEWRQKVESGDREWSQSGECSQRVESKSGVKERRQRVESGLAETEHDQLAVLTSSGSDTQNRYRDGGHGTSNNAITSAN